MSKLKTAALILLASALALLPAAAGAANKCKKGEVFVESKTPIRRGPGLNYPVGSFLERGRCLKLGEISLDKTWVLVKLEEVFGWVPVDRLSGDSQDRVAGMGETNTAPVGSGQRRGVIRTKKATILLSGPAEDAKPVKALPADAKLIALSVSLNERFVEARDDRGQVGWVSHEDLEPADKVLELLPRTDSGVDRVVGEGGDERPPVRDNIDADPEDQALDARMSTRVEGLAITLAGFGGATVPSYSLSSNGADAIRRYDITAMGAAARVEGRLEGLLPISLRLGYAIGFLGGLEAEGQNGTVGGMSHELGAALELPLYVAARTMLRPELGYMMLDYGLDPALPGAAVGQFFSSQSHLVTAGLGVLHRFRSDIGLEARVAFLGGASDSYPFHLGNPGFAVGAMATVASYFPLSDSFELVLRYDLRFRSGGFTGQSALDETITEATLSDFVNGLTAGLSWSLN